MYVAYIRCAFPVLTKDTGFLLVSWEDYARCVHAFLAGLGSGVDVDFSKRNLVALGHSMGAVAV